MLSLFTSLSSSSSSLSLLSWFLWVSFFITVWLNYEIKLSLSYRVISLVIVIYSNHNIIVIVFCLSTLSYIYMKKMKEKNINSYFPYNILSGKVLPHTLVIVQYTLSLIFNSNECSWYALSYHQDKGGGLYV